MLKKISLIAIFACLVALMVIGTLYDEYISMYVYDRYNLLAVYFDYFGELPVYILVSLSFEILFVYFVRQASKKASIISIISIIIAYAFTTCFFIRFFADFMPIILCYILGIVFVVCIVCMLRKINAENMEKLKKFALFVLLFFCLLFLINQLCKYFVGRTRFYDIENGEGVFTPWYQINGLTGGKSFYSGHTTSIMALLSLNYLFALFNYPKVKRVMTNILIVILVILVGASRIIYGAHFLTDVTFACIMGLVIYLFVSKFFDKLYDKLLNKWFS